jgi:hypothetical protein
LFFEFVVAMGLRTRQIARRFKFRRGTAEGKADLYLRALPPVFLYKNHTGHFSRAWLQSIATELAAAFGANPPAEAYWAQLLEHAQRNNLLTERAKAFLQSQQSGALARPPPYISHSQLGARPGAGAGEPPDPNSVSLHLKKPRLEPSLAAQRTDQVCMRLPACAFLSETLRDPRAPFWLNTVDALSFACCRNSWIKLLIVGLWSAFSCYLINSSVYNMQQLNDEAMRYELLRRQQERLRTHMQGLQQYAPAPPEAAAGVSDQSVPLVSSLQVCMYCRQGAIRALPWSSSVF